MKFKILFFSFALLLTMLTFKINAQVLETEESRPLLPGRMELGFGLEFQTSKEGTETALPLAWEFGLTKKLTLLVEPVGFTAIRPKIGTKATGSGDLEMTLFYHLLSENKVLPSISISGEVKIPTTKNRLIGTGETDFTPYFIASKTTGKFYTSVDLSYTFLGKPKEVAIVNNLFNYAIGTIFTASSKSILFAEIYGNTSALSGGENPEETNSNNNLSTAELTGGETVGAFGYGYYLTPTFLLSLGVNYDNNKAVLLRPGIEWKF